MNNDIWSIMNLVNEFLNDILERKWASSISLQYLLCSRILNILYFTCFDIFVPSTMLVSKIINLLKVSALKLFNVVQAISVVNRLSERRRGPSKLLLQLAHIDTHIDTHIHTYTDYIEWVDPVAIASLYADWSKVFAGEDQLQQRLTRFLYAMLHILRVLPSSNDCENAHGLPGVKTISKIIVIVQEGRGV